MLVRNNLIGHWVNGYREGHGTFYYMNGSKYEGEWKNDQKVINNLNKHGRGIYITENGRYYRGDFFEDRAVDKFESFHNSIQFLTRNTLPISPSVRIN
jgi:hypothetical protein